MQRAALHIGILLFGLAYLKTPSTLLFVFPIWAVSFVAAIRNRNERFDVIDMFWLLNQLSFVVAPLVTIREAGDPLLFATGVILPLDWGNQIVYHRSLMTELNVIIFLVSLFNLIFLPKTYEYQRNRNVEIRISIGTLIFILIIAVALEVQLRGGLSNTLAARRFKEEASAGLATIFFSAFTLAWALFLAAKLKSEKGWLKYTGYVCLFGLMLLLYNPFNASRFMLLQAILPLLLITFPAVGTFKNFSLLIMFGLVIVMPILSETTRAGISADLTGVDFSPEFFLGYLDQHKVLMHLLQMVQEDGSKFGSSMLSVLLFFVPRAIWPDKPLVLGLEVGNQLFGMGLVGTANLSGPIFGDLYYDFGLLGIIFGAPIVAYAFRKFLILGESINGVPALGIFLFAALPILFRGTVGAVIGPFIFTVVFYYLILFLQTNVRWSKKH